VYVVEEDDGVPTTKRSRSVNLFEDLAFLVPLLTSLRVCAVFDRPDLE
jgi:hypothetical protein